MPGRALNHLPREVLEWENEDARTCCATAECFGLCYLMDVFGAVGTMTAIEEGANRRSLHLFVFYELCWPCMRVATCCCGMSHEEARGIPRLIPPLARNTFDLK